LRTLCFIPLSSLSVSYDASALNKKCIAWPTESIAAVGLSQRMNVYDVAVTHIRAVASASSRHRSAC